MPHVKVLCVAEKPSIAKSVAGMLSGGRFVTRATRNKYIKNYEFQLQYGNQPCTIVMTALLGHLMELEFAPAFKNWNTCPPLALFDAPIIKEVRGDMQALKQNLQSEARNSQTLVIWTDCDLEGENIGEEVAIVCQQSNPRLSVKRARFSVVQPREIKQAWDNLVMLDLLQAAAVNARQELDLRIGAAFTRFQTLHAQVRFVELAKKILSYGSCQFPTLGFVVDQYKRHQNFVSEPFWKLEVWVQRGGGDNLDAGSEDDAKFSEEDALPARGRRGRGRGGRGRGGRNQNAQAEPARKGTRFTWARGTLFDEECCSALHALCLDDGGATVIQVSKKPTEKWRPLPLTTVELQKTGSRYLKISSDRVMSIAEKLYNNGYISYPRTETDIFDDNFSLHPLIELQTQDPRWGEYAAGLLSGRFRRPRRGKNNDKAHPPIHPTNAAPDNLSGEELKIFEFVTRRFLACCSENAKGNETIVKIQVASEQFSTTGLMITERNYLDVYPYDKWTSHVIPEFQEGEHLAPIELEMKNGHTTAPQLLTEADLINIMDKSGIGTDATIHEHIKKILEREYAVKANGQYFCPTTLGMALVEAYDSMDVDLAMSKPYLRSQMEASMRGICSGTRQKQEVVHESLEMYRTVFATAMEQADRLEGALSKYLGHDPDQDMEDAPEPPPPPELIRSCTKCRSPMYLRRTRNDTFIVGCSGYPNCREGVFLPPDLSEARRAYQTCPNCSRQGDDVWKVSMKFRPGRNLPFLPPEYETCLFCDRALKEFSEHASGSVQRGSAAQHVQQNPQPIMFDQNQDTEVDEPGRVCRCGELAATRTVQKDGPNKGRSFYCCSKPQGGQCELFAWTDDPNGRRMEVDQPRGGRDFGHTDTVQSRTCQCGAPAASRTVQKDGPNKGRQFFCCKNKEGCEFFEWADQPRAQQSFGESNLRSSQTNVRPFASPISGRACECGEPAVQRTVAKEGPTQGKAFFCCSKPQSARCNYFEWVDAPPRPGNSIRGSSQSGNNRIDVGNGPNCQCGNASVRRTVAKEGPNCGRQFFVCGGPPANRCNFFEWADGTNNCGNVENRSSLTQQQSGPFGSQENRRSFMGSDRNTASGPNCKCGESSATRTVQKEGPNQGRPFYCCAQQRESQCDFFAWADQTQDMNAFVKLNGDGSPDHSAKPKCECGLVATLKESRKENENSGRKFWTCSKSGFRCQFFAWVDELPGSAAAASNVRIRSPPRRGSTRGRSRGGRGGGRGRSSGTKRGRTAAKVG